MVKVYEIRETAAFSAWIDGLRDKEAQKRISARILRLEMGNWGDFKFFEGVYEVRIDYGPGYRLYCAQRNNEVIILLCGGDKRRQKRDIAEAIKMAKEV